MIRRYIRAITRQSLDEWSRLELAITAAVTCLGLPYLALVIVAVGSEARYALDGSVAMGHIVSTRVSGRNAQNIDVTYSFVTADGQSRIGNASTPTDWHVAKDPITVELLRSDPDVNRPYYDGRILDELPRESVTLGFALSMFAISLFPWLGHRWRDRLERELRRSGARASATVESVKPYMLGPGYAVVRYTYVDGASVKRFGEAYARAARLNMRPGDRGFALFAPAHPQWSMWIGGHA